jgi:hypothetical protein
MSYLMKKFDENGKELRPEKVCINEEAFQQYIDQHGLERAQGYRDAFKDLFYDLENKTPYPFSVDKMSTQAKKFLERNEIVLNLLEQTLEKNQNDKELSNTLNYKP